jgi:hypothetical protein
MMKKIIAMVLALMVSACSTTNIYNGGPEAVSNYNIGAAYQSVVLLRAKSPNGMVLSATGFAYDKDRVLTAGHFCIDALKIQIFESGGKSIEMDYYDSELNLKNTDGLRVEEISDVSDLCMLRKENHGLPTLKIVEDYSKLKIRDNVTIVGAPSGVVIGEFSGKVMSLRYTGLGSSMLTGKMVVSSASTGGISGSPIILDRTGEVVGVLVVGHVYFDHLSFGVNGDDIHVFLNGLK